MSPEGRVSNGSSRVQLRTALLSAPMAAFKHNEEVTLSHSNLAKHDYKLVKSPRRDTHVHTCLTVLVESRLLDAEWANICATLASFSWRSLSTTLPHPNNLVAQVMALTNVSA